MSLYIAGAVSMHARMKEGDWKNFDSLENSMEKIAEKHNVFIGRYSVDDAQHFVITNDSLSFDCFYEGEAFEYNECES